MTNPRPGVDPATRAAWWEADDALSVALFLAENPTEATELVKAEVDRLRADLAAARRVIEQLKRYHYHHDDTDYCNEDGFIWPCRTFRALSAGDADGQQ